MAFYDFNDVSVQALTRGDFFINKIDQFSLKKDIIFCHVLTLDGYFPCVINCNDIRHGEIFYEDGLASDLSYVDTGMLFYLYIKNHWIKKWVGSNHIIVGDVAAFHIIDSAFEQYQSKRINNKEKFINNYKR